MAKKKVAKKVAKKKAAKKPTTTAAAKTPPDGGKKKTTRRARQETFEEMAGSGIPEIERAADDHLDKIDAWNEAATEVQDSKKELIKVMKTHGKTEYVRRIGTEILKVTTKHSEKDDVKVSKKQVED